MWKNVKLGIAPIGWTNDDMPKLGGNLTYEQMLSEAALAGFPVQKLVVSFQRMLLF